MPVSPGSCTPFAQGAAVLAVPDVPPRLVVTPPVFVDPPLAEVPPVSAPPLAATPPVLAVVPPALLEPPLLVVVLPPLLPPLPVVVPPLAPPLDEIPPPPVADRPPADELPPAPESAAIRWQAQAHTTTPHRTGLVKAAIRMFCPAYLTTGDLSVENRI